MCPLQKMKQAGFNVELIEGRLSVTPASKLSPSQDEWIRGHKDELIQALRLRDLELKPSPSGHDHQAANDERALIHIPSFKLQTGEKVSFDMTVPRVNVPKMRESVRFVLKDDQGAGSILGEPGKTRTDLADMLKGKYGDRLESIEQ